MSPQNQFAKHLEEIENWLTVSHGFAQRGLSQGSVCPKKGEIWKRE